MYILNPKILRIERGLGGWGRKGLWGEVVTRKSRLGGGVSRISKSWKYRKIERFIGYFERRM